MGGWAAGLHGDEDPADEKGDQCGRGVYATGMQTKGLRHGLRWRAEPVASRGRLGILCLVCGPVECDPQSGLPEHRIQAGM